MKPYKSLIFSLGMGLLPVSAVAAQATPSAPPKQAKSSAERAPLTSEETAVLNELHATNVEEIAAGKLALKHAAASDVKQYGQMLITDHTKADQELSKLAKQNGVQLNDTGPGKLTTLEALHGKDFDREFLSDMVTGHQKAIDTVKTAQDHAQHQGVRALLDKTLPTLQHHERQAQQLSSEQHRAT